MVVGRGPIPGCDPQTLEVESPAGKCQWTIPVSLDLDRSENDWLKIVRVKGWWVARVWHEFGSLVAGDHNRIVWSDADARFNGALDVELQPEAEVIAGPWWYDPENRGYDVICSGLLVFQGARQGVVESIADEWSRRCLLEIPNLPVEERPWPKSDQEVLTEVMQSFTDCNADYTLLKMEHEKYVGCPVREGKLARRALVDSWYMIEKMRLPETRNIDWPPPEEYRRNAAIGTPVPGSDPDAGLPAGGDEDGTVS